MTSIRIVFLGTSAAAPQKNRFLSSIAMHRENGEIFLFDCGEGLIYQMLRFGVNFQKISKILLSHYHGDHWFGIFGILTTMKQMERKSPLEIIGPPGIKRLLEGMFGTVENMGFPYPIKLIEIAEGLVVDGDDYRIISKQVMHSVTSMAYAYIEKDRLGRFNEEKANELKVKRGTKWQQLQKGTSVLSEDNKVITPEMILGPVRRGFKIVIAFDGLYEAEDFVPFAKEADVLVMEATYDDSKQDKAKERLHSTARWSARIAKQAQVKRLYLTHISARYKEDDLLEKEANEEFSGTIIAHDGLELTLNRRDLEENE